MASLQDQMKAQRAAVATLQQLSGNYDEDAGWQPVPTATANQLLAQYFQGGGTLKALTDANTAEEDSSSILGGALTDYLNNYYATINPSSLNSPQAYAAMVGNPWGLNTADASYGLGVSDMGEGTADPFNLPSVTPKGYVPFNPAVDIAQVQGMGGTVYNPNDIATINGLTYTPRSNIYIPHNGDFLSNYGPALAMAGFGGLALAGALPGAASGGLVGGATGGELAGGAVGGGGLSGSAGTSALTEFLGGAGGGGSLAGAGALGGATAATGGTGLSGLLGTTLFTNPLTGSAVTLGGLLGNALPSLANYFTQKSNANSLQDAIDQATKLTEPFASQYPFYQNLLQQVWTNPNFFANNPATLAGANILQRQNAKLGQLYSGNAMGDIANYLSQNQLNYSNALAPLAGATIAPGQTGSNLITGQQAVNNTTGQALASLGNIFGLGGQTAQNSTLNNTINNLGNQVKNYLSNLGASTVSVA